MIGLSGYLNKEKCEPLTSNIAFNSTVYKSVSVYFKEGVEPGVGYTYLISGKTQYDKQKKVLKIGNYHESAEIIQLDKDFIIGLDFGELKCIIVNNL